MALKQRDLTKIMELATSMGVEGVVQRRKGEGEVREKRSIRKKGWVKRKSNSFERNMPNQTQSLVGLLAF